MAVSSDADTNSTQESDGNYDLEHHCDVDIRMEDDADPLNRVDLNGDVDIVWNGDNAEEEDERRKMRRRRRRMRTRRMRRRRMRMISKM